MEPALGAPRRVVAEEECVEAVRLRQAAGVEQALPRRSVTERGDGLQAEPDSTLELLDPGMAPTMINHCSSCRC